MKDIKLHQKKFNEIKELLISKLGEKIVIDEENGTTFLQIEDSEYWLSVDHSEFTVGFGLNHKHFSEEYDNLKKGIEEAFKLLTHEIRVTKYIKGKTLYKAVTEIKISDSIIENLGVTGILFYPFWKKNQTETSYFEAIIKKEDIESEIEKIVTIP
ncbi:hypothetical protein [Chryseobacterium sp. Mn2064]|uniref:hypothetical protein n=1 Tax=Chryseobacterium sp. Mn2064 TaxID=3395263 RepID=UPI003BBBACA0